MGLGSIKIRWWATAQLWAGAVLELLRGDRAAAAERERRAREAAAHYERERCPRCGGSWVSEKKPSRLDFHCNGCGAFKYASSELGREGEERGT